MTANQAKDRLVNFQCNSKTSIFDMSVEMKHLVVLEHSYVPAKHRGQMVVDHLVYSKSEGSGTW